jgi:bifunctional enzyme CysN/CysC
MAKEQMNIVIVGHVDHGKSTVIGRLLADTGSLPDGKVEQVRASCERNAKPFEYAFLLDALKDERSQGITIDTARCFFKTVKRDYIILDAPGHAEFLKNMVTGASHAEAALLVIDAKDGIRENTKRHGVVISMVGIKQVAVLVNKMDLVGYSEKVFADLEAEYRKFLSGLDVVPVRFIPISAFCGDNLVRASGNLDWYRGPSVLEQLDAFKKREAPEKQPFRFPVQDVYKFTEEGDDRRILAGTIETGTIRAGEEVVFLPSGKKSNIRSIEEFNVPPRDEARAGEAAGFTLTTELYIPAGEVMVRSSEAPPKTNCRFRANIFWVGKSPMIRDKVYKLKLASARVPVKLVEISHILDADDLSETAHLSSVNRHDVAACVLETLKPVAYDLVEEIEPLSRFVIVDHYEIAGGGIILEEVSADESVLERQIQQRETRWERGWVRPGDRAVAYTHRGKFIFFTGSSSGRGGAVCGEFAKHLEKRLFGSGCKAYYFDVANLRYGLGTDVAYESDQRDEEIRRLGELARVLTDAGQIFIAAMPDMDSYDIEKLKVLVKPYDAFIVRVDAEEGHCVPAHLNLTSSETPEEAVRKVRQLLKEEEIIFEYYL